MPEVRETPYHEIHRRNGGRMVPFAGWEMPVQFPQGIIHEHLQVRSAAGLFDVSHMGRFRLGGSGALAFANHLITNDLAKIKGRQLLYSALCNPEGGIIDDVTLYHLGDAALVVANAANAAKVWEWIAAHRPSGVDIEDLTGELAQVALQGPRAAEALPEPFGSAVRDLGYYHHTRVAWQGAEILISRNGYTGEDGFEIYVPATLAVPFWEALIEAGQGIGLEPVGLGARDSLRFEVNYALYGNELSLETTPLEAGLRWVVKFKKDDFIGKEALLAQREAGVPRTLVGFEMQAKRLARHGYPIRVGDTEIGFVTSGGYCPSLKKGMGMGYVTPEHKAVGTQLSIDARGTALAARVVERPFYKEGSVRKG
ncbi:MAG: glycine cleavage system aminomethyltransferase GcvT [Candidatus Eisenbacteria sp.]|nr:glycine cleavage system aminomethyltransferase GcvT [Candidatus Eisenbacteria bacterium]